MTASSPTVPLRVLVVDDEHVARQRLRRLLGEIPGVDIVGEATSGREAVDAIGTLSPELVLLDVRMPGMTGIDVARAVQGSRALVVFVTAFEEHALRAFEVHAVDYLVKPVEKERLQTAVERVRSIAHSSDVAERHTRLLAFLQDEGMTTAAVPAAGGEQQMSEAPLPAISASAGRFLVKDGGTMYFVPVSDVDWLEAYGNYVRLHVGKSVHLIRQTLSALDRALDPARFVRVHRSAIVNLDRVVRMDQWGSGDYKVVMKDGTKLKLSRWYRSRVEQLKV